MKTLIITKEMLDADNFYIGSESVENFEGHIEISANLGYVKFKGSLRASGRIVSLAGTSIKAGNFIKAGTSIKAGESIEAGWFIEAGTSIKAGESIKAGGFIEAGGSIVSKWIDCRLRIFAGLINYRLPTREEMQIKAEIRNGTVAHGEVVKPD